ncbi:MAG: ATP-binding protein [Alcanivoracaceae bacterium]
MATQYTLDTTERENGWQLAPTYTLKSLELFNWGGFSGLHRADIDVHGTAIIGPTGSGKTTLVDALMTLISANPKYNLASTGGHESDRDLVSYVRGVTGPGDGGEEQSHISRQGRTTTGLSATLSNGSDIVRLGALLWFDGSSMSPSEMNKLWLFSTHPGHTLESWLTVQHEGGARALRQLDKTETGIWTYPSKKAFLARLRDFFEVRDNAFNLLNRAAGLKQLNSIDEIFRDLVLDDNAQFERAKEVADSFDDLAAIHEELEVARRQQKSLEPIKVGWERFRQNQNMLDEKELLTQALPAWFGEQAHLLWKAHAKSLTQQLAQADAALASAEEAQRNQEQKRSYLNEAYLKVGGANIETLQALIKEKQNNLERCELHALEYKKLVTFLSLPDTLNRETVAANKAQAKAQLQQLEQERIDAKENAYEQGIAVHQADKAVSALQEQLTEAQARPDSNIRPEYQRFRALLASELALAEDDLPFIGELVQVKKQEAEWRGAIERAIGSDRLRILVPPESVKHALKWVNSRHNALHVRILEVKTPDKAAHFLEDGFTRKLDYKNHPYRETVKHLLANKDHHCVASPEMLRDTPHAMTVEGMMSGKARFFDKQDQKRLTDDWQTGFDNRDTVASLENQLGEARDSLRGAKAGEEKARATLAVLDQKVAFLKALIGLDFSQVNIAQAQTELQDQQDKLYALTSPGSDATAAKQKLDQAQKILETAQQEARHCLETQLRLKNALEQAEKEQLKAFRRAEPGLSDTQRRLAELNLSPLTPEQLDQADIREREAAERLRKEVDKLHERRNDLEKALVKAMSDALREDRGALSEAGRELEDVPRYLDRLTMLTEEALPEKQQRFKEYLNRSSDEGVSQLLSTIEGEVERIEERLEDLNHTLRRVDFERGRYLQLVANKVVHDSLRIFTRAHSSLASARFIDDGGESQYKALQKIVELLRDACERHRTLGARALLDPRFRLEFKVSVLDRDTGTVIETRSGSQGGSGGEKEIIASYVLTASLSYALCPDGSNRPLFGTIVLDEAFSRSSHAVAGRIIAALEAFHLHALFITPNKEMRLLRKHTRSAVVVHRRGNQSSLTPVSWQALDEAREQHSKQSHEITE